jgi:hypothetical protein
MGTSLTGGGDWCGSSLFCSCSVVDIDCPTCSSTAVADTDVTDAEDVVEVVVSGVNDDDIVDDAAALDS